MIHSHFSHHVIQVRQVHAHYYHIPSGSTNAVCNQFSIHHTVFCVHLTAPIVTSHQTVVFCVHLTAPIVTIHHTAVFCVHLTAPTVTIHPTIVFSNGELLTGQSQLQQPNLSLMLAETSPHPHPVICTPGVAHRA